MIPPVLMFFAAVVAFVMGVLMFWRTIVNHDAMTPSTNHGIRLLNWLLTIASAALIMAPFVDERLRAEYLLLAALAALFVFVVCMFLGRRPTDRVLGA